jgi:hypothetical protein
MNIYRQFGPHCAAILAIAFPLFIPAALAEHTSIIVPNVGPVLLDFRPAPHSMGNFSSVKIESAGNTVVFTPKNPIAHIPSDRKEKLSRGLWENPSGLRIDPSRFFFRGEYTSDSEPHTLLFFISEGYASEAPPLLVIGFSYVGEPYKVLELDEFDMTAFQKASDNTALIIGNATLSQVMGGDGGNGSKAPYATTYDPFSVFIVPTEGNAYYSLEDSRRYNQQHYVWAGPHSREDYAVLYNLPGHPKPMGAPASRVEALLGGAKVPKPQ